MRPALVVLALLGLAGPARGFDAATTHAGLTEKALFASSLRQRLGAKLGWGVGRSLGLFQTLTLGGGDPRRDRLLARLATLDPADNAAPHDGTLPALGWLVAGSIVEEAPPLGARNHFFDPTTGEGLKVGGPLLRLRTRLSLGAAAFDGRGVAATAWLTAADNDLGLPHFLDARERAVAGASLGERDSAAAEALLVAGALLHVVEDAAEPAYVHADFRVDLFDARAPFTGFVAARYGRFGLPAPAGPARPLTHLSDAIHHADQGGLADRTAARFYSAGLIAAANGESPHGATRPSSLPPLVAGAAFDGWLGGPGGRKVARWSRLSGGAGAGVRWALDARTFEDMAAVLLPEAAQAALSALEHLFRGGLTVEGGAVRCGDVALGAGRLRVLVEGEGGVRSEVLARDIAGAEAEASLLDLPESAAGKRVIAVFRGVDKAGEPLVVVGDGG